MAPVAAPAAAPRRPPTAPPIIAPPTAPRPAELCAMASVTGSANPSTSRSDKVEIRRIRGLLQWWNAIIADLSRLSTGLQQRCDPGRRSSASLMPSPVVFSCLYEFGTNRVSNQECSGIYAKLAHCGRSMRFHRFYADVQGSADAFIAVPLRDQLDNHLLSRRENFVRVALSCQHAT